MKQRDLLIILKEYNFRFIRSNGHLIYTNDIIRVAVPHHKEHSIGLVRRIMQQMGLNKEQIKRYL
jgi:predicted RNA binding protein YcfA (HicA-like mRNA interferase family)